MKVTGDVKINIKPIVGWLNRLRLARDVLLGRPFTISMPDADVNIVTTEDTP